MEGRGYKVSKVVVSPTPDKLVKTKLGNDAYSMNDRAELARRTFPATTKSGVPIEVNTAPSEEADAMAGKARRTQLADWLRRANPNANVVAITGEDATVPGAPQGHSTLYEGEGNHKGYYYVTAPRPKGGLSSSQIRAAMAAGQEPPGMTPEAAAHLQQMRARNVNEPTLPGMENVPAERAAARGVQQAQDMSEEMARPQGNVEAAAGEMERNSPLFNSSEAGGMSNMFAPQNAQAPAEPPRPGEIGRPSEVRLVPTDQLHADPRRFQWRAVPRSTIPEGAKWDQAKAGAIDVWRDPEDGKLYVVDGHHRLAHAQATGTPEVEVRLHHFASAQEGKQWGALRNLEQGNASPFDAALYLRESGLKVGDLADKGINLTGDVMNKGAALANLSPEMWEQYRSGQLDESKAVAVGSLDDPAQQAALAKIAKTHRLTSADLAQQARRIQQQGNTSTSETGLFGPNETSVSNALATGRLADKIEKALSADRNALQFIAKADSARRAALERGKNIVNVDQSSQEAMTAAALADHFRKVQYKSGPVGSLLEDAGRRITQGEKADVIFKEIYPKIRDAIAQDIGAH